MYVYVCTMYPRENGLPLGLSGKKKKKKKNLPADVGETGDTCSIPEWGHSPGGINGNPLQYCFLENPMDRGAWWATVCGSQSRT